MTITTTNKPRKVRGPHRRDPETDLERLKIAEIIRTARLNQSLSFRNVRDLTGEPVANLSRVEKGNQNYTLDVLLRVCRALNLTLEIS